MPKDTSRSVFFRQFFSCLNRIFIWKESLRPENADENTRLRLDVPLMDDENHSKKATLKNNESPEIATSKIRNKPRNIQEKTLWKCSNRRFFESLLFFEPCCHI